MVDFDTAYSLQTNVFIVPYRFLKNRAQGLKNIISIRLKSGDGFYRGVLKLILEPKRPLIFFLPVFFFHSAFCLL